MEQTKGTFKLAGKSNIEKIAEKDYGWIKKTNLSIKTLKDNFVNVTFEEKNGKGLDVNIKRKGDEKSHKVNHADVVTELKETFDNNDMLFVLGVVDYDTYRKDFVLKPTGVYLSERDYDDDKFEETNFIEQEFVFESFNNKKAKLYLVSYFKEVTEVEMIVDDCLVSEFEKFKTGDLLKLVFSVVNKPIYADGESGGFTPIGRGVTHSSSKKTVSGYDSYNLVVGIANVEYGKYTRKEIRETQEEFERRQAEYAARKENTQTSTIEEDEEELPF